MVVQSQLVRPCQPRVAHLALARALRKRSFSIAQSPLRRPRQAEREPRGPCRRSIQQSSMVGQRRGVRGNAVLMPCVAPATVYEIARMIVRPNDLAHLHALALTTSSHPVQPRGLVTSYGET